MTIAKRYNSGLNRNCRFSCVLSCKQRVIQCTCVRNKCLYLYLAVTTSQRRMFYRFDPLVVGLPDDHERESIENCNVVNKQQLIILIDVNEVLFKALLEVIT